MASSDESAATAPTQEDQDHLARDLADAMEQFAATNEVVTALGRHASDPDAVLGTIVESARTLCQAEAAQISLLDGGVYRLSRSVGVPEDVAEYSTQHPIVASDRSTLAGRVGLDRRTQQR